MSILFSTYTGQQLLDTSTIKLQKTDSFLKNIILEDAEQETEMKQTESTQENESKTSSEPNTRNIICIRLIRIFWQNCCKFK